MNQNEYKYKLETALKEAVYQRVSALDSIVVRNYLLKIASVENVYVTVNLSDIKLHTLLSGAEIEVVAEGTIVFFEAVEGGSSNRDVTFWIRNAKVKFDSTIEKFKVVDISKFLAIDFSH